MNNKTMTIAVVLVLTVAGIGGAYALIGGNGNGNGYNPAETLSEDQIGRLAIMGNANGDDYIDSNDLDIIDGIIDGSLSFGDYPMADANNDGRVDSNDRNMVVRMIDREPMKIKYVNGNNEIKEVKYPLNRVIPVGTNAVMTLQAIGAVTTGKVVGVTGEAAKDTFLFSDVMPLPKVSTSILAADFETVVNIGDVDAIITMDSMSYLKNESTFTGAGIDVVRISSSDGIKAISVALTMGYLLGLEERSNMYAEFCDEVLSFVSEKKELIPENDIKTCLTATMSNYVSGKSSDYYALTILCGGDNLADWTETTRQFNTGDEWLLNEKYYVDHFIHFRQFSYDTTKDYPYDTNRVNFAETQSVKDGNYCLINSQMPAIVRLAYVASIMYPEIYGADYGDQVHQEYIDDYLDNLSSMNYSVADRNFVLTDADFIE